MPRGKRSKARAQQRHNQNRVHPRELKVAQRSAAVEEEWPSSSAHDSGDALPSTSTAGFPQMSQSPVPPNEASEGVTLRSSEKQIKGHVTSRARSSGCHFSENLMEYMHSKYKMNQPSMRGVMMGVINHRPKEQLPEIFKRACQWLDVGFDLDLKELEPNRKYFKLVKKLHFSDNRSTLIQLGVPTMGILILLLSVIYLNDYHAPEQKIWQYLNLIGIFHGIPHIIFSDARKLITQSLVEEKYLKYHQVPYGDPPVYEFLWGHRAYSEICKEKILDFLIRYKESIIKANESAHEDVWTEEEDKGQADNAAQGGPRCKV